MKLQAQKADLLLLVVGENSTNVGDIESLELSPSQVCIPPYRCTRAFVLFSWTHA
jgi:hypothetical protein